MSTPLPSIHLITVDQKGWTRAEPGSILVEELSLLGRKMAKGLSLQDVRTRSLLALRQISQWMADSPDLYLSNWTVPTDLLPEWGALLGYLAKQRAAAAAVQLGKEYVLPFFPALFPPSAAEAGAYGRFDVAAHRTELNALFQSADVNSLKRAVRIRLERFQEACRSSAGIVETIFPL